MRSVHGQLSDNQPIRRSLEEKYRQLRDLKETLAAMKAHTSPARGGSVGKGITRLEAGVAAAPVLKAAGRGGAPRTPRPARPGAR